MNAASNLGFYQAAAGVLAVLLLTGVLGELRAIRDERDDTGGYSPWERRRIAAFFGVWLAVFLGEIVTFNVLAAARPAKFWEQIAVEVALAFGFLGVIVLAGGTVITGLQREIQRKWARNALAGVLVAGSLVALAVTLQSGPGGLGSPPTSDARVLVAVDVSASMGSGLPDGTLRIDAATDWALPELELFDGSDEVGLWTFPSAARAHRRSWRELQPLAHPEFRSWWAHEAGFRGISPVFAGFRDRRTSKSVGTRFGWSG